jgi:FKBP-type peptidyl-prolyl cis-trans isomerase (trigger factor)
MKTLHAKSAVSQYLQYGLYVSASIQSDPEVAVHAQLMQAPYEALQEAVTARHKANDEVVIAEARRNYHARRTNLALKSLGIKALGHFEKRDHPGYRRLLPQAPSAVAAAREVTRRGLVEEIVKAAGAPATPAPLSAAAKALAASWKDEQAAQAALERKREAEKKAREAEDEAKAALVTAGRRLSGRLTDQFPDDKARVASYFPVSERKRPAKTEPAKAPA